MCFWCHPCFCWSSNCPIVLCWEEKVRLGAECSLLLKHSKWKIVTILKSSSLRSKKPNISSSSIIVPPKDGKPITPPKAEKKKKNRNKKKRLESLLAYHQRLVTKKGMPPSRLMLKHTSSAPALPVHTPKRKENFTCSHYEYSTPSKLGLATYE